MAALRQGLFVQGTLAGPCRAADRATRCRTHPTSPCPMCRWPTTVASRTATYRTGQRMQVDNQTVVAIEGVPEGTLVLAGAWAPCPRARCCALPGSQAAPPLRPARPLPPNPDPRTTHHVVYQGQSENPVFATMVMLAFVVLGVFSYQRLKVDQFPEIDFRWWWSRRLPGASPEIVESEVTKKIEEGVNSIAGINALTSRSYEGSAVVIIEFQLHIDGRKAAEDDARKVATIRNPAAHRGQGTARAAL